MTDRPLKPKPYVSEDYWIKRTGLKISYDASIERVFKDIYSYGNDDLVLDRLVLGRMYYHKWSKSHVYLSQPPNSQAWWNDVLVADLAELQERTGQRYVYAVAPDGGSWYEPGKRTSILIGRKGRIDHRELDRLIQELPRKRMRVDDIHQYTGRMKPR